VTSATLSAALAYASKGWPVHPLMPGKKTPATRSGFKDATTDSAVVDRHFKQASRGIGIRTGEISGLVVFDIDPRNGGTESLRLLTELHGPLPETLTAATGGGGWHYYFRMPDLKLHCKANLGGHAGVDLKGENAYVVAPPSNHPSGGVYRWTTSEGADAAIAELPAWISELASRSATPVPSGKPGHFSLAATEGNRNPTIFDFARKLRDAGLAESDVVDVACQTNKTFTPPLSEEEVRQTVKSVFSRSAVETSPITDMGNARRFVDEVAGNLRYEPVRKTWFAWTGTYMRSDDDGEPLRAARRVALTLEDQARTIEDHDLRKKVLSSARQQQSLARLNAMVELARTEPEIPILAQNLDTHHHLLNVANGVVDLRTGILMPHDRSLLLTKVVPTAYNPKAKCPRFLKFLDQVFEGDRERICFMNRVMGYVSTGDASEQVFFICVGAGANGKSTLLNGVSHVLDAYAGHTPSETLVAHKMGRSASNDLARLRGLRLVTASEFNPDEKLATGLMKQLTGNEKITARFLYREHEEYVPTCKFVLATNDIPHMDAADDALFRRVVPIPFNRVFSRDEQDHGLSEALKGEAEGILAWIVRGAVDWYENGLRTPKSILSIVDEIRREMDPVAQFLDDVCIQGGSFEIGSAALHGFYATWAHRHGVPPLDGRSFGKGLAKRGFRGRKSNGRMVITGLQFRPEFQVEHLSRAAA